MERCKSASVFLMAVFLMILSISLIGCSQKNNNPSSTFPTVSVFTTSTKTVNVASTTATTSTLNLPANSSPLSMTITTPTGSGTSTSTTTIQNQSRTPSATTIKILDGTNDLFDGNSAPISGEAYLDIVEAEISIVGTPRNYLFRMKVNGPVPTQLDDPKISIEWDFFIDSDLNPATGWNYPIACNDIGPDYMISYNLSGNQGYGTLYDISTGKFTKLATPNIIGDTIELSFTWTLMQQIDNFNCVVAARKWVQTGPNQKSLSAVDKAPNVGHYNYPKGK